MRVVYVANFSPYEALVRSEEYVLRALQKLGHEVIRFQVPPYRDRSRIGQLSPDVILVSHCRDMPTRWIKNLPRDNPTSLVVQWLFDSLRIQRRERRWFLPRARVWHLSFLKDRERFPYYESLGIRCHWLQEAAPDFPFAIGRAPEYECDIAFLGNPHSKYRLRVLRELAREGFRIHIHCHPSNRRKWRKVGPVHILPHLHDEAMAPVCSSARFVLGVGVFETDWEGYWSNRVYNTLAHGGLALQQYVRGLEQHFDNRRHLLWWKDIEDCKRLIREYHDDEEARFGIRTEGYEHVRRNHSFEQRCVEFIDVCRRYLGGQREGAR